MLNVVVGGGDVGYSCETTYAQLISETVETTKWDESDPSAMGDFNTLLDICEPPKKVVVTFNGTEYICDYQGDDAAYFYGATYDFDTDTWDWSEYPFATSLWQLATENAGTYSVIIKAVEETITVSDCFAKARGYSCEQTYKTMFDGDVSTNISYYDSAYASDDVYITSRLSDTIRVKFDGTEYVCDIRNCTKYGASFDENTNQWDWSEYPFMIFHNNSNWFQLMTENSGTYHIEIESLVTQATTTECFNVAVQSVPPKNILRVNYNDLMESGESVGYILDKTGEEIFNALEDGENVRVYILSQSESGVEIIRWGTGGACGPRRYWFAIPILRDVLDFTVNTSLYEIATFVSVAGEHDDKPIHIITP